MFIAIAKKAVSILPTALSKPAALVPVLMVSMMSGCTVYNTVEPGDPAYAPVLGERRQEVPQAAGSLYRSGTGLELFSDNKAHRLGDVITVVLNERTVSQKTSNVSIAKESDNSLNAGPLLGTYPTFKNLNLDTDIGQGRDFSGESDADQSNRLEGNITVTVAEVLANGNLVVRGEKWMTLNRGDEYIRISGIVRPDDVTPDNTVLSNRLANARISYSGTGDLANSNQMGWLSQFFNSPIWPL
ncbi:flagellar basal body L-ring protein FlgH [Pseudomaricurvus sp.]|uniref:flagellar basal body L-ring protein FlgH n=1 Tax=Pseudomaricurvus sp. TaxID=2004510 RepID=UPI003F6ABCF2